MIRIRTVPKCHRSTTLAVTGVDKAIFGDEMTRMSAIQVSGKGRAGKISYQNDEHAQDAAEELTWIEEKKRKLQSNNKAVDDSNLTEKIKLLQKHQALQVSLF
jgi:hypothetical protein